ncbi:MAG: leucine-rich repeat domain-containing protein, partial [Bacteroidaceae bacterium]|nr:leucine-rich repeat domain-containing protein [Bacteroidaceae bacterium]
MKKTKLFGMALSAILACTGIVSCNNDDDIAVKPAKHPDYYISYQTSDNDIVRLNKEDVFGGAIVKANTYSRENGYGTLEFHSKVMAVEDGAFYEAKNLTHIKIPGSAGKIGYGAFWRCCSLKSITMPDGITEIGNNAFSDCLSLQSIT